MEATTNPPRLLTPEELATFIKLSREMRKWSQEQLASISRLSTRTVQRVENGKPSDLDTRRALARAFGFEDIDVLNKPFKIPTPEELVEAKAAFEREHITLKALPVDSGRHLAGLLERHSMDMSTPGFEMERSAEETFAQLVDYMHEYRDCHDLYSEVQKLELFDELQGYIDQLRELGISLRFAERNLALKVNPDPDAQPFRTSALYVVTYRLGHEPDEFVTPRKVRVG